MAGFGALALLLACVGVYAMFANMAATREREFGVPPFDPIAIGLAVLVLVVCAGLALLGPVRRATRVDPIMVLR